MPYQGAIFDVDGLPVDSPHELAWREALKEASGIPSQVDHQS
jgi:beta-phosphoglucomutase-like phosphatase (HAD superfamily)